MYRGSIYAIYMSFFSFRVKTMEVSKAKPTFHARKLLNGELRTLQQRLLFSNIYFIFMVMMNQTILQFKAAFRIHLILMWIRIRIRIRIRILGSTFGKSGSGSSDPPFHNSGSGSASSDPHLEKVDLDPDLDQSTLNIFRL